MIDIPQAIFSNAFLEMRYLYFDSNCIEWCFQGSRLQQVIIGSANDLCQTSYYPLLTIDDVNRHMYVSWGLDVLTLWGRDKMAAFFQTMF